MASQCVLAGVCCHPHSGVPDLQWTLGMKGVTFQRKRRQTPVPNHHIPSGRLKAAIRSDLTDTDITFRRTTKKEDLPGLKEQLSAANVTFARPLGSGWMQAKALRLGKVFAGVLAVMAAATIGDKILQQVDSVPFLPDVETLIGTIVTAKLSLTWLMGGEGRARIESFFEDLNDRIRGTSGSDAVDFEEPSMMDIQLKSLLEEHVITDASSTSEFSARLANKQAFLVSLKNLLITRELRARRVNSVLRRDLENLTISKNSMWESLNKVAEEHASLAAKVAKLTESESTLQGERDAALSQVSSLSSQWSEVTSQVESLTADRSQMRRLNDELRERASSALAENTALRQRADVLEQSESAALLSLEEARLDHAKELISREQEFMAQMEDLQARIVKVLAENEAMAARIVELETSRSDAEVTLQQTREEFRSALIDGLSARDQESAFERKRVEAEAQGATRALEAVKAERDMLASATARLEERVLLLERENFESVTRVSHLEQQLQVERHASLENAKMVERLQEDLRKTYDDYHASLVDSQEQLADLKAAFEQAERLRARVDAAETAADEVFSASHVLASREDVAKPKESASGAERGAVQTKVQTSVTPRKGRKKAVVVDATHNSGAGSTSDGADSGALELKPRKGRALKADNGSAGSSSEKSTVSGEDLKAIRDYARSVRDRYVDWSKPVREQESQVEAFVQELMRNGAPYDWARTYVQRNLAYERAKWRRSKSS